MGKLKQAMHNPYLYNTDNGLPEWQHQTWHENMPDLTGEALADAIREYDATPEADDMPLWIQLELDLWEGQHGIGTFTAWDLAEGGHRG